ncbi:MAG: hypothetical protein HYY84_15570 [Deltaproteobacteria bacterium]|nr:hypothetical protein [Deltaproteobacteria bacterium]
MLLDKRIKGLLLRGVPIHFLVFHFACGGQLPSLDGANEEPPTVYNLVDGGETIDAGNLVDGGKMIDAGNAIPLDAGTSPCADTWQSFAQPFFRANCEGCHAWERDRNWTNRRLASIRQRISSGSMPPRQALAADLKQRILRWIDCGAP